VLPVAKATCVAPRLAAAGQLRPT